MNTYHAELEFDWWERKRDFNKDMWEARMSLRKIWVIIHALPPDSALGRKLNPLQWTAAEYLLSDMFDVLASANWQRAGDSKAPRPQAYPRPGVKEKKTDRHIQMIKAELARRATLAAPKE